MELAVARRAHDQWLDDIFFMRRQYLHRNDAIPRYLRDCPQRGLIAPMYDRLLTGWIADGTPDSWGRRVIGQRCITPTMAEWIPPH